MGISLHTPVYYIKVGFSGVFIALTCFPDERQTAHIREEHVISMFVIEVNLVYTRICLIFVRTVVCSRFCTEVQ